jgi:hypothetical protein
MFIDFGDIYWARRLGFTSSEWDAYEPATDQPRKRDNTYLQAYRIDLGFCSLSAWTEMFSFLPSLLPMDGPCVHAFLFGTKQRRVYKPGPRFYPSFDFTVTTEKAIIA